ncbi:hypothetical protein B0H14DRAFT_2792908 [Mycena olivaceomarginata]|nr:hypothetical protein B0H14DRAFT_2792908 [Mycena olivaceomarginata]
MPKARSLQDFDSCHSVAQSSKTPMLTIRSFPLNSNDVFGFHARSYSVLSPSLCNYGLFARHQTCFPSRSGGPASVFPSTSRPLCVQSNVHLLICESPFLSLIFLHFTAFPDLSRSLHIFLPPSLKSNPWVVHVRRCLRGSSVLNFQLLCVQLTSRCPAYLVLAPSSPPDPRCSNSLPLQPFGG